MLIWVKLGRTTGSYRVNIPIKNIYICLSNLLLAPKPVPMAVLNEDEGDPQNQGAVAAICNIKISRKSWTSSCLFG